MRVITSISTKVLRVIERIIFETLFQPKSSSKQNLPQRKNLLKLRPLQLRNLTTQKNPLRPTDTLWSMFLPRNLPLEKTVISNTGIAPNVANTLRMQMAQDPLTNILLFAPKLLMTELQRAPTAKLWYMYLNNPS